MISEADIQRLVNLGDTNLGYVARQEVAEMYGDPVDDVDRCL